MIDRRSFLAATASLAVLPWSAFAQSPRLSLKGAMKPGELIVGRTEPGAVLHLENKLLLVSADGGFAFGFPYNRKTPSKLNVRYADGTMEDRDIILGMRDYEIQRIDGLPQPYVSPPAEILERIKRETELFRRARSRDTSVAWFADAFDWPVPGIISSLYGSQRILNGEARAPHLAVDIAAPTGTPIHAPADGIVSISGDFYLDGGFTILDHGHGVSTCYGHQSKRLVTEGDRVTRGQLIGEVGQTGRATGPNLHWGMNWFDTGLDPSLSTATPKPARA